MHNSDKYELIDRFLSGELSKSEKVIFDKFIQSDSNFSNEVEKVRLANKAIYQLGLLETTRKLDQLHHKKVKAKSRFRFWSIGAGVVFVLSLGAYGVYNSNNYEPELTTHTPDLLAVSTTEIVDNNNVIASKEQERVDNLTNNQENKLPITHIDSLKAKTINTPVTKEYTDTLLSNKVATTGIIPPIVSEDIDTTPAPPTTSKLICEDIVLTDYKTEASCAGQQTGKLIYSHKAFLGGTSPYKTVIFRQSNQESYLDENQLPSGQYAIKVVDSKGCVDTISNITISEKRCLIRIDDSFSPKYGEVWEYPIIQEVSVFTLVVKDMSNVTVLEKQILLDEESDWNGELENGSVLGKGVYLVEIKSDQETYAIGTITIIE